MPNPIAVLISDVHYSVQTLALADAAMRQAISKANNLGVPLIVAGDLHDTKANLRGECVNAMLETFKLACYTKPYVIIGNHDRLNEKDPRHSLNFLQPYVNLIDSPTTMDYSNSLIMIPYQHDANQAKKLMARAVNYKIIIMHQGLQSSNSGDYIQDKSAISPDNASGLRVISGHYHTRQTIPLPNNGSWSYIGNPYTLNYGEADDPEKGFQVLYDDGSLGFIPTKLRKHIVIDTDVNDLVAIPYIHEVGDLLWFKCRGTKEELRSVTKQLISANYGVTDDFRLELIPMEVTTVPTTKLVKEDLLDSLINSLTATSEERKLRLKDLWRKLGV